MTHQRGRLRIDLSQLRQGTRFGPFFLTFGGGRQLELFIKVRTYLGASVREPFVRWTSWVHSDGPSPPAAEEEASERLALPSEYTFGPAGDTSAAVAGVSLYLREVRLRICSLTPSSTTTVWTIGCLCTESDTREVSMTKSR